MAVRKFRVRIEDEWFEVEAEEITEQRPSRVSSLEPAETVASPRDRDPKAADTPSASAAIIAGNQSGTVADAPLPGTILEVKVAEGDRVAEGQVLMILEAMKMENEIIALTPGVVRQIVVAKGQSVAAGDPLVILD